VNVADDGGDGGGGGGVGAVTVLWAGTDRPSLLVEGL